MTDPALLEKLESLTLTVQRLENRVEDLEDHRDLQAAMADNAGKPLVEWERARKLLELD